MAAALGLMPVYTRPTDILPVVMSAATGKRGYIVALTADTEPSSATITTTAGQQPFGVIVDEGDPNNSDLHASGAVVSVATGGICDVMFDAAEAITKGDKIICSGTDGLAKVLAAEADPYWLLGEAMQTITIGSAAGKASVKLAIQWVAKD